MYGLVWWVDRALYLFASEQLKADPGLTVSLDRNKRVIMKTGPCSAKAHTYSAATHHHSRRELDYIWPARDKAGWRAAPNLTRTTEVTSCNGARLGLGSAPWGFLSIGRTRHPAGNHLI